jgi:hypothetical protein
LSEKTKQDATALTSLVSLSYSIWQRELVESSKYDITYFEGGRTKIRRKVHKESSARVLNLLERCDCQVVFSFGAQCRHELAMKMVFIKEHWLSRHLRREKLSFCHLSEITQTPKPPFDGTGEDTPADDAGILGDNLTYDDPPLFSDDLSFQPDQSPSGGRIGSPGAFIRKKLSFGGYNGSMFVLQYLLLVIDSPSTCFLLVIVGTPHTTL